MKCPKCRTDNPETARFCLDCGTKLGETPQISFTKTLEASTDELTRGTLLGGRYEIIEELGKGGTGRVYRAYDKKIEEEVALKLIRPEIAAEKRIIERFRNEIKTARKIRHANVCGMFDLQEEENKLFITMEYVRGEDLKSVLRRMRVLAAGTAVSIARQVAAGLAEAHRLGVVHRDLKPSNIMIDKDGNAKIMDFGIARSLEAKEMTGAGVMIGTPEYMSPEQVEGKPADVRSDIYALGVILFELITGRPPFEGETSLAIAHKHRYEPAPDPRTLNPQIPLSLSRLILRCLEKAKERRFQTTAELLKDLAAVEETLLPTAERAPTPSTRRKPTVSKTITVKITPRKFIIPAAALTAVVIAALGLLKFFPKKAPPPSPAGPPSVAVLYFKNNTGDKTFDIWREGLCQSFIIKLSQSRHIRVLDQSQIFGILKRLNLLDKDNYTPEELKEIAKRTLATHILRGSLSKAGERFRVDPTLQKASTLEIIAPESIDGRGEESLFALVDELAVRLKSNLGLTSEQVASEIERSLRDATTNSTEAYKLYIEAVRLNQIGSWDQSIPYLQKAISADPQFAMAYLQMSVSYHNTGRMKECRAYLQKAFDLRQRLSERERYLIEAEFYLITSERTWEKAIAAFTKLIELYPWDFLGNGDLGFLYGKMEEWEKAIERYEVLRRYKIDSVVVYHNLAWNYLEKGQVEKAREALEGYLATIADNGLIRSMLGIVFIIQGDFNKAEMEIKKAYTQSPEMLKHYELWFNLLSNDFAAVESLLEQIEASPMAAAYVGFGYRSIFFALRGRIREAKACLNQELERWQDKVDRAVLTSDWLKLAHLLEKKR